MFRSPFTLSCLLLMLLSACSKSHSSQTAIAGKWRLMKSTNTVGVVAHTTNYSNEMRLLQLRSNWTYTATNQSTPVESGSYRISVGLRLNAFDTIISFKPQDKAEYWRYLRLYGQHLYLYPKDEIEDYQRQ